MSVHNLIINLTDNQEQILSDIFLKTGKTIDSVCSELIDIHIMSQLNQWIKDEVSNTLATMDDSDALIKLKTIQLDDTLK